MTTIYSPLVITSPTITGSVLSVDADVIPVVLRAPLACTYAQATVGDVIISTTDNTQTSTYREFTLNVPCLVGTNTITLLAGSDEGKTPITTLSVTKTTYTGEVPVTPPSGVTIHRGRNSCKIEWATPTDAGFLGVRVQTSVDSSGVLVPYKQIGDLVSRTTRAGSTTITLDTDVEENVAKTRRVTTKVETIIPLNFSSVEITPEDAGGQEFFVILSTLVYDPATNFVYESVYNGPFRCSTVDLRRATPGDFPFMQSREDIAGRMISEIIKDYPDLDLTPRSEIRDLTIDPLALELSEASVRQWFGRCSYSVSAMCQIDDTDGDGISDPVSTSTIKQQLARAWYLSASEMQALIDKQFDLLGERAGLTRGGTNPAITQITVYTYNKPTTREVIEIGTTCSTIPDSETPSVQFTTMTTAVFDPNSVDSYYDPEHSWWAVTIPVRCNQSGTIGNVGAKTIRQPLSGIPAGYSVTNLSAASYGQDKESNTRYAERIQDRLVAGVDTGTRRGYLGTARSVPGVTDAQVVASGDLEMLRDWDHTQRKHIFGTVDIYVRGNTTGQQDTVLPHLYPSVEKTLSFTKGSNELRFVSAGMTKVIGVLEVYVTNSTNVIYLGCSKATVDLERGVLYLDPTEAPYIYTVTNSDETTRKRSPHPTFTTNALALAALSSQYTFKAKFREMTPLTVTPTLQPVMAVASVTSKAGILPQSATRLIKTQDPLLLGGSNKSTDRVEVDISTTVVAEVETYFVDGGLQVKPIDSGMYLGVTPTGGPANILSVRSKDKTTLYTFGKDYNLIPNANMGGYSITRPASSSIPLRDPQASTGGEILVAYYKLKVPETLTQVTDETVTVKGTIYSRLANPGIVTDTKILFAYGITSLDTALQGKTNFDNRYLLVTYKGNTMVMNKDFVVSHSQDGVCEIARVIGGAIPDEASLQVSYVYSNVFTIKTSYPTAVQQVSTAVESTRHAAADVVVKAMQENYVDMTLTVELEPNASPEVLDPQIRTVITMVMDQAKDKLSQSEMIRQIKSLTGIKSIQVPFQRFSKADGSYDIGHLIPAGTSWKDITTDSRFAGMTFPKKTFITSASVLPNRTMPGGGLADSYVGLLYEGFSFKRMSSVSQMTTTSVPSFYIVGYNDTIQGVTPFDSTEVGKVILNLPSTNLDADVRMENPGSFPFRVTYQIWFESGFKDITISPSEYLRPGRIAIDYVTPKKGSQVQ